MLKARYILIIIVFLRTWETLTVLSNWVKMDMDIPLARKVNILQMKCFLRVMTCVLAIL